MKEYLRIKRIRYKCPKCGKTHTFELIGIERNKSIRQFVETAIKNEFFEIQSFTTIAKRYDVTAMQELFHYDKYESCKEAEKFMERIIAKLNSNGNELLYKVADSYKKWNPGIINGLTRNQTGRRYSNTIAENDNSHIRKVIDVGYGYKSFERFRLRIMLILTYKKQR